jgi:ketosteroid isomerase-like protein
VLLTHTDSSKSRQILVFLTSETWLRIVTQMQTKLFRRLVTLAVLFFGCVAQERTLAQAAEQARQITLTTKSRYPQVRLSSYTLIYDDNEEPRKDDAEAVMQVKIELPRAVQTKDAERFERILAPNFVFRAEGQFYGRADYIRERANNKDTVMTADYENVVLQFIGDVALLTYRNIVVIEPGGPEHTARMTWADILVKEGGQWKFRAVYLIDSKWRQNGKPRES